MQALKEHKEKTERKDRYGAEGYIIRGKVIPIDASAYTNQKEATQKEEGCYNDISKKQMVDWLYRIKLNNVIKKKLELELERQFKELSEKWRKETGHFSTMIHITRNDNYLRIIALGKPVIRHLLRDLQNEPDYWFEALRILTNENPVKKEHLGSLDKMSNDWLDWGRSKGYIK